MTAAKGLQQMNFKPDEYVHAVAERVGKSNKKMEQTNKSEVLRLDDFVAYLPKHNYLFLPTREPWPATSVNARIAPIPLVDANGRPAVDKDGKQKFIAASSWLDEHRAVEQMTWCPGLPMLIKDRLVAEGGWIKRPDCTILNLYRPPTLQLGNPKLATPWLEHVHRIYPNERRCRGARNVSRSGSTPTIRGGASPSGYRGNAHDQVQRAH